MKLLSILLIILLLSCSSASEPTTPKPEPFVIEDVRVHVQPSGIEVKNLRSEKIYYLIIGESEYEEKSALIGQKSGNTLDGNRLLLLNRFIYKIDDKILFYWWTDHYQEKGDEFLVNVNL